MDNNKYSSLDESINVKDLFQRYLSYWPFFIISILLFIALAFFYLRYATYIYQSTAKIEVIDKAQDSDMALPTAMTIFNRSMINLENEIGVLSSFQINERVVKKLKYNLKYYTKGIIKSTVNHPDEWFDDYELNVNEELIDYSRINQYHFDFYEKNGVIKMNILTYYKDELINTEEFNSLTTTEKSHKLPFDFKLNESDFLELNYSRILEINDVPSSARSFQNSLTISEAGQESDQLVISIDYPNIKIAEEYLTNLIYEFDYDGIADRRLVHERTIDFVNSRFDILTSELKKVEDAKEYYKVENNLTDVTSDANLNIQQKLNYNSELFDMQTQLELSSILLETVDSNQFNLIPINIGLNSNEVNTLILDYNKIVKERKDLLASAGSNNSLVKNLNSSIIDLKSNIRFSINNYKKSLNLSIDQMESKENEFSSVTGNIPENEKILRSIERELNIKESLFLLLLQKKEEAAINYAVVKPSIKIIDYPISDKNPHTPRVNLIYIASLIAGIFFPYLIISILFFFDTKIHTKEQLQNYTKNQIPVLGEIPHINDKSEINTIIDSKSRSVLAESIRMILANLNYSFFEKESKSKNKTMLVTSSIKGEGKTIVSTNIASILSSDKVKVLLIGADLRNPQVHKLLNLDKSVKGLTDYLFGSVKDVSEIIYRNQNLDIILSGTIPPNPTQILSSNAMKKMVNDLKTVYDYIIIDSAPCLLVSDTYNLNNLVDFCLYVVKSNHTDKELGEFINEINSQKRIKNMNLILNGVGQSAAYGYKYGYHYGYRYKYNYGYDYGYKAD